MQFAKFKTLNQWAAELGGAIPASTLRAEVIAGNLKAIRARESCNAPILISETEMGRWLEEVAGKRRMALSPAEAGKVNAQGDCRG